METQRGFTRRFDYNGSLDDDPTFAAVFDNDFDRFKAAVDVDKEQYSTNTMLLYFLMKYKRWEMFNYIINFDTFNPDCVDNLDRTLLMSLAAMPSSEAYAEALLKKGANVSWRDGANFTFLHLAAREVDIDNTKIAQMVIERGADINARNDYGETPLYIACHEGNTTFVDFLVCYGADPHIPAENNVLPIACSGSWISAKSREYIQEMLFDYTFDDKIDISLATLTEAMIVDTPLFQKIAKRVSQVLFSEEDLEYFCSKIKYMKLKHLRQFIEKFGDIIADLNDYCPFLYRLIEIGLISDQYAKEILDLFLESDYVSDLIQIPERGYSAISSLVEIFNKPDCFVEKEEITKTACLMLSYGLHVTSIDLDTVFKIYGYCDLFKILLHMDIIMVRNQKGISLARLYYDLNVNIEEFSENVTIASRVLDYYNHPKLREVCLNSNKTEIVDKVKKWPEVPRLIELSRNAARGYLLDRYRIENSRQFYTILKWLPSIGDIYKKILSFQKKLYWL